MLPESQGKGAGKLLLAEVEKLALENDDSIISLNVNRFNSAYNFYEKLGFKNVGEEDIELDFGYLMEDYKLEKKL
jgi:GNAT superfamily N-acetyltransferase